MKKYGFLFLLFLLVLIFPTNAKAFRGSYRYDINKVIYNGTNLEIYGWAVINSGTTAIHNIETEYTLDVFGVNSNKNLVSNTTFTLVNVNKSDAYKNSGYYTQPSYSGTYDRPRDYTKAFFSTTDAYSQYPTSNGIDRAIAIEKTGNKFYINTDFCFIVPIYKIKTILNTPTVKTVHFDLNVKVPSRTLTVYGKTFRTTAASKTIHLAIPNNRVVSYVSSLGDSKTNLEFTDTPKGITNIASDARAQANPRAFIGTSSVKYVKAYNPYTKSYQILQEKFAKQYGYNYQYLYYGVDGTYTKIDESFLTDIGNVPSGAKYGYFYYTVNISLGSGNVVQNGGTIRAFIPALWGTPTAGSITGMEIRTKTCQNYCIEHSDDGKCPTSTTTNISKDKCCNEICSKTAYKDKDFCVDHCKQTVVVKTCDDLCKSLKKGSTCPTTNKTTPSKDNCCKELCYDTKANSTSYYCQSVCTYTCKEHYCNKKSAIYDKKICDSEKCNPSSTSTCKDFCLANSKDKVCPSSTTKSPTKSKCCEEICYKTTKNKGSDFCKNYCGYTCKDHYCNEKSPYHSKKICESEKCTGEVDECAGITNPTRKYCCYHKEDVATCNPSTTCDASITDPQEKYCKCENPSDPICNTYKNEDDDYNKETSCSEEIDAMAEYKYPKEGYGDEQFQNTACKVSCSETIRVTFPKAISEVRAGMGFTYPVRINSTRYCTAEYLNDTWKTSLESAVTNLKNSYTEMTNSINKAYTDDVSCGNRAIIDAGNLCSGGETLTSDGRCKGIKSFDPAPSGSYSSDTYTSSTSCSSGGAVWNCTTSTSSRSITGYTECDKKDKDCSPSPIYGSWSSSSSSSTATRCSGSYEGGTCYSYRGACPARSTWNTSLRRCEKIMCSNKTGTYFEDAQSAISPSISTANSAKARYLNALTIYNTLINDRNTCDNYTSQIIYNGANRANISINTENNEDISQTSYSLVGSTSQEGSPSYSGNKDYTINYCNSKSTFVAKDSIYVDGVYPISGENLSLEHCNFISRTFSYPKFWNKSTSATNTYEFSKNYSVMDYNGEILETTNIPNNSTNAYKNHGRYAYTDFYALSGVRNFTDKLTNIGANIGTINKNIFKLDFNCSYNINNLIFPQEGDPNYNLYGSVGFIYRSVSLDDMFPNRNPRENWAKPYAISLTNTIESNGYSIYSNSPKYLITLTGNTMNSIRNYNSTHSYDSININSPYTSNFITEYLNKGAIRTDEKRGN
jgi:hypothetical protein